MKKLFLGTDNDITALVLRVILGVVMFPHGAQKLLGWFGGHGFTGLNYVFQPDSSAEMQFFCSVQ